MSKTFFITGISSGLGLELTKKLLTKNHKVIGTYLHGCEELERLKPNDNLQYLKLDNFDFEKTRQIISKIDQIDVLVNNAGIFSKGLLQEENPNKIISLINTNLTGAILTTQAVLPIMQAKNQGIIFFVNSVNAVENKELSSVYGASKWGLRGFATNLRLDLKDTNIKIFNFYPAGMQTELFNNAKIQTDLTKYMSVKDMADLIISSIENADKYLIDELVVHRWK